MDNIDFNKSYEWYGDFWFPDSKEQKFSGKIKYTPENGVSFLCYTDLSPLNKGYVCKKIMHANVRDDRTNFSITLFDVMFELQSGSGSADAILFNHHALNTHINELHVKYSDSFKNFFSCGQMKMK